MWTENGDAISEQYGGSRAMHSAEMTQTKKGPMKVDKRDNSGIFVKRYFNNVLKKDVKKQMS